MGMRREKELCFDVLNLVWACLVVAPMVVLYWKGTWDLLADMVYPALETASGPENERRNQLSGLLCYLGGFAVRILLDLLKYHLAERLAAIRGVCMRSLGGWLYIAVYAFAGISFWRGVWYLMDLNVGDKVLPLSLVLAGSVAVLVFSRVSRSLISSPLSQSLDRHDITFQNSTFFRKAPNDRWWFFADVLFTNLVIRQLIVFGWWSLWTLENLFLIDKDIGEKEEVISYDSLMLGYSATFVAFLVDRLLQRPRVRKAVYMVKLLEFLVVLLAFFASVNVWRGLWSIYDNVALPGISADFNNLVCHAAGLVVLSLLMLSNTISNDRIEWDVDGGEIVTVGYWGALPSGDYSQCDEMVPIIE